MTNGLDPANEIMQEDDLPSPLTLIRPIHLVFKGRRRHEQAWRCASGKLRGVNYAIHCAPERDRQSAALLPMDLQSMHPGAQYL